MNRTAEQQLLTIKVVVGTLLAGALVFGAVVFVDVSNASPTERPSAFALFAGIWLALVLLGLVTWIPVRGALARQAAKAARDDPDGEGSLRAVGLYATAILLGGALAEGATLAVSVFALVESDLRLLALAVPGLLALLALLPSERKLARFVAGAGGPRGRRSRAEWPPGRRPTTGSRRLPRVRHTPRGCSRVQLKGDPVTSPAVRTGIRSSR